MAQADLAGDSFTLSSSGSESARFGLSVFRLTVPDAFDDLDALRAAVTTTDADVIVARYPSRAVAVPRLLATLDLTLLPAPALVYWEAAPSERAPRPLPDGLSVSHDLADPAVRARAVARIGDIFAGYVNHYSYNPLFPAERSLAGYQEWAERTIRDSPENSSLLRYDGEIVGVATMIRERVGDARGEQTEVTLAGLVPAARGRGWYEHLLAACITRTGELGIGRLVISTQVTNTGVQRAWTRLGLLPFDSVETVHLVRRGLIAQDRWSNESLRIR